MPQFAAPIRLPLEFPVVDKNGNMTRQWAIALNKMLEIMVQRPHTPNGDFVPVVDGDPVLWDGTSGRFVK